MERDVHCMKTKEKQKTAKRLTEVEEHEKSHILKSGQNSEQEGGGGPWKPAWTSNEENMINLTNYGKEMKQDKLRTASKRCGN